MPGFDPIINSKLNRLLKGGGYSKGGKVLTYDGNKEGKEVFFDEFVKVSGIAENANAAVHISVLNHGEVEELEKGAFSVIALSDTVNMIVKAGEDNPILVFVSAETNFGEMDGVTLVLPIGTYIVDYGDAYVTRIEFAETIVPIDQKYLPENVIELKNYGFDLASWVFSGGGKYTIDDAGTFWTDIQKTKNTIYRERSGDVFWDITPATQNDMEVNFRLITTYGGSIFDVITSIVREGTSGAVVYVMVSMQTLPT